MKIYRINGKAMLEHDNKTEYRSPKLAEEFSKLRKLDSPSFLVKRMSMRVSTFPGNIDKLKSTISDSTS